VNRGNQEQGNIEAGVALPASFIDGMGALEGFTLGVEVRPNRSDEFHQPWHWLAIPILGVAMGEMFPLDELAEDCAKDGVYEILLVAPVIPFTNGAGSPVNPMAIK